MLNTIRKAFTNYTFWDSDCHYFSIPNWTIQCSHFFNWDWADNEIILFDEITFLIGSSFPEIFVNQQLKTCIKCVILFQVSLKERWKLKNSASILQTSRCDLFYSKHLYSWTYPWCYCDIFILSSSRLWLWLFQNDFFLACPC